MSKVKCTIGVSVDGYVAGPNQSLENPMGEGSEELHNWMFKTPDENKAEIDDIIAAGAFIMGRNMFGPIRGEWNSDWNGWWGDDPPYHAPVFVLTHYPREPVQMAGGTTFMFVTDGIESALKQANDAAGDRDVNVMGGASTVNQYLAAGLIDELHLHIAPLLLGSGERLFTGISNLNLEQISARSASLVTHITYRVHA